MDNKDLLDRLRDLDREPFQGTVYRYTAGGRPPLQSNTYGARWNPRGVAAIYTALDRATLVAEFAHYLASCLPGPLVLISGSTR